MSVSIEGILELTDYKLGLLTGIPGRKARLELIERRANGEIYIPSSNSCEGFCPIKGCPGHEVKEADHG